MSHMGNVREKCEVYFGLDLMEMTRKAVLPLLMAPFVMSGEMQPPDLVIVGGVRVDGQLQVSLSPCYIPSKINRVSGNETVIVAAEIAPDRRRLTSTLFRAVYGRFSNRTIDTAFLNNRYTCGRLHGLSGLYTLTSMGAEHVSETIILDTGAGHVPDSDALYHELWHDVWHDRLTLNQQERFEMLIQAVLEATSIAMQATENIRRERDRHYTALSGDNPALLDRSDRRSHAANKHEQRVLFEPIICQFVQTQFPTYCLKQREEVKELLLWYVYIRLNIDENMIGFNEEVYAYLIGCGAYIRAFYEFYHDSANPQDNYAFSPTEENRYMNSAEGLLRSGVPIIRSFERFLATTPHLLR